MDRYVNPKIKFRYSEARGRYAYAEENVFFGEAIIKERPFALVLHHEDFLKACQNCCSP